MELPILWLILGFTVFSLVFGLSVASQVFWFRHAWRLVNRFEHPSLRVTLHVLVIALIALLNARFPIFLLRLHMRWPVLNSPYVVMPQAIWLWSSLISFMLLKLGRLLRLAGAALEGRLRPAAADPPSPSRRYFFQTASYLAGAAPFVAAGYGFLSGRLKFTVEQVDVPIAELPQALDGLRLAQLTDIHIGSFLDRHELARAVGLANELNPDLAFVTGDFVNSLGDPLDHCVEELARLKSNFGVFGCNGNHEIYAGVLDETKPLFARYGIRILRRQNEVLEIRGARLNLIGVDYQRQTQPMLVNVEPLLRPGMPSILLCHNPNGFRRAAELDIDLTVAGHTHGGQVQVEILHSRLNPGRFITPWIAGLYRQGKSHVYVSRGIGTIAAPVRLGVPPEITLLRLRRA